MLLEKRRILKILSKGFLEKFWIGVHWKKKKRKTWKFMDAGSNNRNEREEN